MRTEYRNGDEITLTAAGCDGCSPSTINGLLYHESGCPDLWRDHTRKCKWCGGRFRPAERGQVFCEGSCAEAYHG